MAYALVMEDSKIINNNKKGAGSASLKWMSGFFPSTIGLEEMEASEGFTLYYIFMPSPQGFFLKRKRGRRLTIKKWLRLLERNNIREYMTEDTLKTYLEGGWCGEPGSYPEERVKQNAGILFGMEPLSSLNRSHLSITLTGVERHWLTPGLLEALKNFRQVNIVSSKSSMNDIWDNFILETGVPVCLTTDMKALLRSDIRLSFEPVSEEFPFNGIHVDLSGRQIIGFKHGKRYRLAHVMNGRILRKLGMNVIRRFNREHLICFLLEGLMHESACSLVSAEEILGIKMIIEPFRCSS